MLPTATIALETQNPLAYYSCMDREAELRKDLERCPWCGGKVQIIVANEPGEMSLVACAGTVYGDLACTWQMTGQEADKAIATLKLKPCA